MNLYSGKRLQNNFEALNDNSVKTLFERQPNSRELDESRHKISELFVPIKMRLANFLLASQDETDFARLSAQMHPVTFKSGDIIYRPNSPCEFVYFPETAVFSQLNILEDGKTIEIAMIGNEGVIGLSSILGYQSSNYWTQASVGGKAFKICTEAFSREFVNGGTMQKLFLSYLNSYITQISQRAVCNNHHHIEKRFSTWLLLLDDRCLNHNLTLTHEQIAQFLGVHRPSVTNIAQNLRVSGVIDYIRGRIFILDRQKLQSSACECYSLISN